VVETIISATQKGRRAVRGLTDDGRAGAGARRQPRAYRERGGGRDGGEDQQWKAHWRLGGQILCPFEISGGATSSRHRLPKSINGLPVDVEETGLFRPFAAAAKQRVTKAATLVTE
jgi:hypothetical protein